MAERVNIATDGSSVVQQSTHKDDMIGTVIGGNAPTGGKDASILDAHTNYGSGVVTKKKEKVWGDVGGSASTVVTPKGKRN